MEKIAEFETEDEVWVVAQRVGVDAAQCPACGGAKKVKAVSVDGVELVPLETPANCPACGGFGRVLAPKWELYCARAFVSAVELEQVFLSKPRATYWVVDSEEQLTLGKDGRQCSGATVFATRAEAEAWLAKQKKIRGLG